MAAYMALSVMIMLVTHIMTSVFMSVQNLSRVLKIKIKKMVVVDPKNSFFAN